MVTQMLSRRPRDCRQSTGTRVRLTDRDLVWLTKLQQHGPLPTSYLLAYTAALRASEKRQRERLGCLFHETNTAHGGPYIDRPPQQFATRNAGYNQVVHQVASAGLKAMSEAGLTQKPTGHHGPWVHAHMVACVTASIEVAAQQRSDVSFIPQQSVLDRAGTTLRCALNIKERGSDWRIRKDLMPDALFGLRYRTGQGDRFRFCVVEADRGSEPVTAKNWNRKSFARHLALHEAYIAEGPYREHLKLTAPLLVLNVVPDRQRLDLMRRHTERHYGACSYQLFQEFPAFAAPWRPPEPNHALLESAWLRVGPDFSIDCV